MGQVSGNPGEFSLGSLNDSTGWVEQTGFNNDVGFAIAGAFVGTISLQVSSETAVTKTRYTTIATYTAVAGPLAIPRADGRYFRFIMTLYTSGTAYVLLTAPNTAGRDSVPANLSPQMQTNNPVGSEF